jgi:hypothetical protein
MARPCHSLFVAWTLIPNSLDGISQEKGKFPYETR